MIQGALPAVSILMAIIAVWSLRRTSSPSHSLVVLPLSLGLDLSLPVQLDEWGRLFGLSLLWPAFVMASLSLIVLFSDATHPKDPPDWPRWLLSLAAAQVVLAAADWLTLAAVLALFDLVYLAVAAPQRERSGWGFLLNGLGTLAILATALALSLADHDLTLARGEPLPSGAALCITVAALVRLAPYPVHFWLPEPQDISLSAWRRLVRLLPTVIGLYLVTRITPLLDGTGPMGYLTSIVGIVGCLVAALLAWLKAQNEPNQAIAFIGLYQTSQVLLSWAVLGESLIGFWMTLNLILGTTALTMHRMWTNNRNVKPMIWWSAVPGGLAGAALAGLPLTVGLFVRLPLYRALLVNRQAGWLALLLLAESALAATLLRVWNGLNPDRFTRHKKGEQPPWSFWGTTALLAMPLLILGLRPSLVTWMAGGPLSQGLPGLPPLSQLAQTGIGAWAAFLLPLVMGYGIYRSGPVLPDEMANVEAQLTLGLQLGWLHRAAAQLLSQARQALWSVGAVLHGEGYWAWMTFSLLLIFLLVLSR
jgi:NADH:ubiquinone oxidoreductase subunit 5 (subunit L)/multisubunit Na+/H+ antiporter MnhA subunit